LCIAITNTDYKGYGDMMEQKKNKSNTHTATKKLRAETQAEKKLGDSQENSHMHAELSNKHTYRKCKWLYSSISSIPLSYW
jgi:hypothetical protein